MKSKLALIAHLENTLPSFLFGANPQVGTASKPPKHLLVGLSGGIDSVVLLHALNSIKNAQLHTSSEEINKSNTLHFSLSAMHIHHGLSMYADQWQHFCAKLCQQWQIPFYFQQVYVDPESGLGIEATARRARYEALSQAKYALKADYLVLAHHQQDQSETFLLQLLRGAGVKGLSAMAYVDQVRGFYRPMLNQITKQDIMDYAQAHQLSWVEDESNQDTHFDRNYVRHQILPVLDARYPQAQQAITRSASHMAEAQVLLDELAQIDLQKCLPNPVWMGQSIQLTPLQNLGEVRAKNAIRYWLAQQQLYMPNQEQLQDYWQQLAEVKPTRYLQLGLKHQSADQPYYLHHYQGVLYCVEKAQPLPNAPLYWQGEAKLEWGNGWHLEARLEKGKGIALSKVGLLLKNKKSTAQTKHQALIELFDNTRIMLHPRAGGEMLQPEAKRPRRELKVLFQQENIPPWQRSFHPLVSVLKQATLADDLPSQQDSNQHHLVAMLPNIIDVAWQASKQQWGLVFSIVYQN